MVYNIRRKEQYKFIMCRVTPIGWSVCLKCRTENEKGLIIIFVIHSFCSHVETTSNVLFKAV